jgi:hypothetical protein
MHGNIINEKSPLMLMADGDGGVLLRTQVDNAATVTFVDFEKVAIGNKIGVGTERSSMPSIMSQASSNAVFL